MPRPCRLLTVMLLLSLGACATAPGGGVDEFRQQQLAEVEAALAKDDPARALALLGTLATLDPGDEDLAARIAELQAQRSARLEKALDRGRSAYEAGNRRSGDAAMMEALALNPESSEALIALRRSASEVSHDRQAEKVASEFTEREVAEEQQARARLEKALAAGKYDEVLRLADARGLDDQPAVREIAVQAHLGLADRARNAGDRDGELRHVEAAIGLADDDEGLLARERALRDVLSVEAYRAGLGLMQSDVAGAIALFERAMSYDPGNLAAKQKLDQARTIKKNLDRIRGA